MRGLVLTLALCAAISGARADALDAFPQVARGYLVRAQLAQEQQTLWAANLDTRLPPASLTKILTALLLLDDYRPNAIVTISARAAAAPPAKAHLQAGERWRVADLLAAMLIHSANDACLALAEWHSGSERQFVVAMNARAQQLHLTNTHFTNACGFDAAEHYSSARDLAALADLAVQQPVFVELTRSARTTIRSADGARSIALTSSNPLLATYPGISAGKTGYTARAGACLLVFAERDGVRVSLLLLNARNRWWDASGLLDLAFVRAQQAAPDLSAQVRR